MPFHANPIFVMTRSINLTPGEVLMKSAAVFLLRVVLLTIAFFVTFVVAASLTGTTQSAPSAATAGTQAQAADSLRPFLLYSLLVAAVFAGILARSAWRGAQLIAAIAFTLYGLQTFITQIETLAYLRHKIPMLLIGRLFLVGLVQAALFAPIVVIIAGKLRGQSQPSERADAKSLAARFAVLAAVYVALYYLFGHYIAWQNPALRQYYSGSTELKGLFDQLRSTWSAAPWMLPLQFARGLLWTLFAFPVLRMLRAPRAEVVTINAALFGVWSFVLFVPNPFMPAAVARAHFWETLWCDLLLGAITAYMLTQRSVARDRSGSSAGIA